MAVTHRSLSVAVESSFGSLSSSTGLPDNSALTYVSIPCERDPIVIAGEPVRLSVLMLVMVIISSLLSLTQCLVQAVE